MKIDVGAAAIAVLGVPFLLCAGWFSCISYDLI